MSFAAACFAAPARRSLGPSMATCLIGLGSNLGDRTTNLEQAIQLLSASTGRLLAQSTPHTTRPVGGPPSQSDYLNAAALIETDRLPTDLLAALQQIERQLGRQRTDRWGPRSLDLDLLLYDQCVLDSPTLVIPHPRLAFRRFVLAPAAEIAAEMIHPTTGFSLRELLARLGGKPVHVSVVGIDAATIARSAARQVNGVFLERPATSGTFSAPKTLEFLRDGVRLWEAAIGKQGRAIISDFWIGEVWAGSDDPQPAQASSECQTVWRTLPAQLAAPHLVTWLEPQDETAHSRLDRLRRCVFQPRQFPVLTCREIGVDAAVAEIAAAVEAME